jgi:hypothetical protein
MMKIAEVAVTVGDGDLGRAALLTAVMNTDGEGSDDFIEYVRKQALEIGLAKPNEDDMAAIEAAQENQQPDPMAQLAEAQAQQFIADAQKKVAEVAETEASAGLKRAQTIKTLAEVAQPQAAPFPR